VACVVLIFNDDQGDESSRVCYMVPGSGPILKQDGSSVTADQIVVGDRVQVFGGAFLPVAAIG